ncbi:MAG: ATP synthase F1 subunit delta [Microthrixaceae bacterium]
MTEMQNTAYADAILLIAGAEGVDDIEDRLGAFRGALSGAPELATTLGDPGIPVARRLQIVEDLLGDRSAPAVASIASLLVSNGRLDDLSAIADAVVEQKAAARGESVAEVRSAVALTADQIDRLAEALTRRTGRPVTVRNVVDPSVVGGVVTEIGDTLIDGSVRSRLTQLREAF